MACQSSAAGALHIPPQGHLGLGQPEGSHSLCPQSSLLPVPLSFPEHTCGPYTCLPCSAFHSECSGALPPAPVTQTPGPVPMALFFRIPSGPPELCSLVSAQSLVLTLRKYHYSKHSSREAQGKLALHLSTYRHEDNQLTKEELLVQSRS